MKTYTIIAGVNGVGKSSLTGALINRSNDLGTIIDADKITGEFNGDRIKGGKAAIDRINSSIEKGINLTQETTLSGSRTLKTINKAREHNYYIRLYYIGVNTAEESIKRIKNRVEKGGHNIHDDDVIRRYNKRFDDLIAVLPYCDEVFLYDNENGFVESAEYKNAKLIIKVDNVPKWLSELKQALETAFE